MPARSIELTTITVPTFGLPTVQPTLSAAEYESRLAAVRSRMEARGLTHLVVYGDREHFANLAFLTGYDPRFEEALLILGRDARPRLFVGNEGLDYSYRVVPIDIERTLFQSFSLLGQWRDDSPPFRSIIAAEGIKPGARVGVVGWKSFDSRENPDPPTCLEIPSYIADALREAAGGRQTVVNATDLFMHPETGLRAINSADQLAILEFGATFASQGVRNMTERIEPGMTELTLVEQARLNGLPLSCHPVINAGPRAPSLASPSLRPIEEGDPILLGIGVWGGLTARAGFVIRDEHRLTDANRDYVETLVKPYFAAAVDWYETIGIGITGGQIYDLVQQHLMGKKFSIALNPGHLIHLDEWVHSSFAPRSKSKLLSGMAIQLDIIPVPEDKSYFTTNVEDGIALADESLRNTLATAYPEMWGRVQARKRFMREVLGIRLREEVLPFSNLPAVLRPYLLSPHLALRAV